MKPLSINEKANFIGRVQELNKLHNIASSKEASIIIMYGRRRVGKTELLEQAFRKRNILKFEGIEGLTEKKQFIQVMSQLAMYTGNPLLAKTVIDSWREFFQLLADLTATGTWTIYLEELQWLANYKSTLIAELKYVWDNFFRHNSQLIIILCGSAPSFILDHVIHSKALYNRSQYEFHLKEFTLPEAKQFLKKRSNTEIMDAYLTVGGMPEYLKWVDTASSVFLSLCTNSFSAQSPFSREYEKIFTSSLASNKHYKSIIELLSKQRFATRKELASHLGIASGGSLSMLLTDLEQSGFITSYYPFNLRENSILLRYAIADNYLQFYFKFIKPLQKNIASGAYDKQPHLALKTDSYVKWLGFAFERFCRKYHYVIAKRLGFSGVLYNAGAFFSKATEREQAGYQIDLLFDRADHVYTICEIKYLHSKVGSSVINEFEKKLALFPNPGNKTIHKVLICNEGADDAVLKRSYFDEIITSDDLFDERKW